MVRLVPVLSLLLLAIPPLEPDQRGRLETARDGFDHREEAFVALVEHVRGWTPELGDAAIRLRPDLDAMVDDPARYRGELCRLTGTIQQQTVLARPHQAATEWFIRVESGRPVIVYVLDLPRDRFRDGQRIAINARFYKRVDFTARDGVHRPYPAFVGAFPRLARRRGGGVTQLWVVAVPLAVLLTTFAVLLVYTRRSRGRERRWPARPSGHDPALDGGGPLPEDPAEALRELRKRAGSDDRG